MIINNKQVNIWRGTEPPPTLYHIWLKDDSKLKIHNGEKWITILDDFKTIEELKNLLTKVTEIESKVNLLSEKKINNKLISNNPVLDATDISIIEAGTTISKNDSLNEALLKLDRLLDTQTIN